MPAEPTLPRQPEGLPPAGSWSRNERLPTNAELAAWRIEQDRDYRRRLALGITSLVLGVAVVVTAATWLIDFGPATTFGVAAGVLLSQPLARARERRRERDLLAASVRTVEFELADVRAVWVDNGGKFSGWLLVLDDERSLFLFDSICGPLRWDAPSPGAVDAPTTFEGRAYDEQLWGELFVAPTGLRIAYARSYADALLLDVHATGPLRVTPTLARNEVGDVARAAKWTAAVSEVPTPPSLRSA